MPKVVFARFSGLALIALSITACDMPPVPTPVPLLVPTSAPTPVVTPTAAPVITPTIMPTITPAVPTETSLQSEVHGYKLTLSPAWRVLFWSEEDGTVHESISESIQTAQSQIGVDPSGPIPIDSRDPQFINSFIDLVAHKISPNSETDAVLTITTVPRDGLSLQDYLAAAEAQAKQSVGVTGVQSRFDDTLRRDKLPTGILTFEKDDVTHQQLVLFGQDNHELILLSLASSTTQAEIVWMDLEEIMMTFALQ